MKSISRLTSIINAYANLVPHSRVHLLNTLTNHAGGCYVKRDDELGFGVTGSKLRKYASLIPYLINQCYEEAVIIGSAYSNNVVGLTQLLIENKIKPTLFLLGDNTYKRQGNLLLISLLVADAQIHWIARKDWENVEAKAEAYAKTTVHRTIIIPEGACLPAAVPGALTLPLDILKNENQLHTEFDHVFIDAGTGLMAMAVILAYAWLNKKTKIHVLLLADTEELFIKKLQQFQNIFEELINDKLDVRIVLKQFKLYTPCQAASFGSVNSTVLQTIKDLACKEGFFTDPIYSAKLFFEAKNSIQENALSGNVLIIHSGGALTLMGFQEQLANLF